jgi:hypothetical protein
MWWEFRLGRCIADEPDFFLHIYVKLLDDLGDRRGYSHLKEEALDRIK